MGQAFPALVSSIGIDKSCQNLRYKIYTYTIFSSSLAVVSKIVACRVAEAVLAYVAFEVSAKRLKEARSIFR